MGNEKGGGGYDTSAMVSATNRGIDLQEKIYEEGKEQTAPYYDVGTSGLGKLADMMGLGGGSVQSRDQVYNSMRPQYTSQTTGGGVGAGNSFVTKSGQTLTEDNYQDYISGLNSDPMKYGVRNNVGNTISEIQNAFSGSGGSGSDGFLSPLSSTSESTNYDGLNSAVDARMAEMGQTPEGYGSLLETFDADKFEADPSYAFRQEEGNKAIERAMAARGKTMTPEQAKALQGYNQDLASTEYQNAYSRYNSDQSNIFNRLAAVSGIGQTANQSLGALGQQYGSSVSDLLGQQANAITSAQQAAASRPSMFDNLMQAGTTAASIYGASDSRLKEDIEHIDTVDGIKRYSFSYNFDPQRIKYTGAMAQDLLEAMPSAVVEGGDGFYRVNYSMLPFNMEVEPCQ